MGGTLSETKKKKEKNEKKETKNERKMEKTEKIGLTSKFCFQYCVTVSFFFKFKKN